MSELQKQALYIILSFFYWSFYYIMLRLLLNWLIGAYLCFVSYDIRLLYLILYLYFSLQIFDYF